MHMIYSLTYNNMTYVGQTNDMVKRLSVHKARHKTHNTKLYQAMRKHGFDKFRIEPLAICHTKKDADLLEQLHILALGNLNTNLR